MGVDESGGFFVGVAFMRPTELYESSPLDASLAFIWGFSK